jgi:hypothetical protein
MQEGTEEPEGSPDVFQKISKVNGQNVIVKYYKDDGQVKISDAYVKNR